MSDKKLSKNEIWVQSTIAMMASLSATRDRSSVNVSTVEDACCYSDLLIDQMEQRRLFNPLGQLK